MSSKIRNALQNLGFCPAEEVFLRFGKSAESIFGFAYHISPTVASWLILHIFHH